MSSYTESTSGSTTTYVITDEVGSTCTIAVQAPSVSPVVITSITNSGNFHADGMAQLSTLMLLWQTGVVP